MLTSIPMGNWLSQWILEHGTFSCVRTQRKVGLLNVRINLIIWPGGVKGGAELRGTFNEPIEGTRESFLCARGSQNCSKMTNTLIKPCVS